MTDQPEREAKIGVVPYSDGSGYQADVRAYTEDGAPYFDIRVSYRLEAKDWPALRSAVEDALALVTKGVP